MTRRQVLAVTASAVTLTMTSSPAFGMNNHVQQKGQTSTQSTFCNNAPLSSLEDILIGKGEWVCTKEEGGGGGLGTSSSFAIPPNFATYATRFFIHYDEGFQRWWKDMECSSSLLSYREKRNRLGKNFGSLARSVQVSLEGYILQQTNVDGSLMKATTTTTTTTMMTTNTIQQRFEDLLADLMKCYVFPNESSSSSSSRGGEDIKQQFGLLFATLPKEYQPIHGLQELSRGDDSWRTYKSFPPNDSWMEDFTRDYSQLLPSLQYSFRYDSQLDCHVIQPSVALYEVGVNDEFGQNVIATAFGPLSCLPLKRQNPNISPNIYALLGLNGALACAMTHSLVIPFDVVKTRMQTDPEGGYSNVLEGTMSIAKSEGIQGFTLGAEATIAGYSWYGLSVYPSYTFFKWYLSHSLLSPAYAIAHADAIALMAGAIAAVIASVGLTPLEACRIRTVAEPHIYRDIGLLGTLRVMAGENEAVGWRALYDGLPSLMIRQVIFGSVKFLAFERACEAFFTTWPFLRDSMVTALGVTLISGALSGALSSVVSQPADSVLTYVAKNKRGDGESLGIVSIVLRMIETEGVGSLYRGLGSRCIWASAIISGQFLLYDIFRTALGINSDDLSQVFQFVVSK